MCFLFTIPQQLLRIYIHQLASLSFTFIVDLSSFGVFLVGWYQHNLSFTRIDDNSIALIPKVYICMHL